jgi:hypothetical protein
MPRDAVVLFAQEQGKQLIKRHCRKIRLRVADLHRLVEEVVERDSMMRRRGLHQAFDEILDSDAAEDAG